MTQSESNQTATRGRPIVAYVVLVATLVQVAFFFFGLLDPINRITSLWGKALEDRRAVVWQPGSVLKGVADRFPESARVFLMYPQPLVHWNCVYYFYPRFVTVTMTNGVYRTNEEYNDWNEKPTEEWLMTNGFTHVLNFKNGGRVLEVHPGIGEALNQLEDPHAPAQ
jgi:hypothetical protein